MWLPTLLAGAWAVNAMAETLGAACLLQPAVPAVHHLPLAHARTACCAACTGLGRSLAPAAFAAVLAGAALCIEKLGPATPADLTNRLTRHPSAGKSCRRESRVALRTPACRRPQWPPPPPHHHRTHAMTSPTRAHTHNFTAARDTIRVDVFNYWLQRRKALGRPLMRRLQAPTPINDQNPYNVFRRARWPRPPSPCCHAPRLCLHAAVHLDRCACQSTGSRLVCSMDRQGANQCTSIGCAPLDSSALTVARGLSVHMACLPMHAPRPPWWLEIPSGGRLCWSAGHGSA